MVKASIVNCRHEHVFRIQGRWALHLNCRTIGNARHAELNILPWQNFFHSFKRRYFVNINHAFEVLFFISGNVRNSRTFQYAFMPFFEGTKLSSVQVIERYASL